MDKFALAQDPMRPGSTHIYIIHLQEPIAIIRLEDDHTDAEVYRSFLYEDDIWVLCLHHWGSSEPIQAADSLIEEAWEWYVKYLEEYK